MKIMEEKKSGRGKSIKTIRKGKRDQGGGGGRKGLNGEGENKSRDEERCKIRQQG